MKRFLSLLLAVLGFSASAFSQYQLDTLEHFTAGPGVAYTKIREASGPNLIYILETDLKNPFIKMQTVKAKNLKVGLERPSVMAAQQEAPGRHVVGIVNADFFVDNAPDNMQVVRGEITRKQRNGYSAVAFDTMKNYMLAYPVFKGSIVTKGGAITIDNVDEARSANQLVIYNSYQGSSTPVTTLGTEAVLSPIGEWFVNDTVRCIVQSVARTTGGTPIAKGGMVLSASGSRDTLLNTSVKPGDTVGVAIDVSPAPKKIKELVGGRPIFFKNGAVDSSVASISVVAVRNPRTLVGFSKDSAKCFILVIDGRQSVSVGMDIYEMSKLMSQLKIYHAMNFDGGGSATMLVNRETVNTPSDGSERAVSNGLMIISTEPASGAATLVIDQPLLKIFRGRSYQYSFVARDKYRSRLTPAASEVSYSCSSRIGTITDAGLFTASKTPDSGWVYVRYGGLADSSFVKILDIKTLSLDPKTAVADTSRFLQFKVNAYDTDGIKQNIPLSELQWKSTDPSIGTVDSAGNFKGVRNGATRVVASYYSLADTASVTVEAAQGIAVIDAMDDAAGWSVSAEHVDTVSVTAVKDPKTQGSGALRIDYSYVYDPAYTAMIYLTKPLRVYGIPDTILIDVRSNGMRHRLYYQFSDDNAELFRSVGRKYLEDSTALSAIPALFTGLQILTPGASFNFPVTISRLEFQMSPVGSAGQLMKGSFLIDNLRARYPGVATSVRTVQGPVPAEFSLEQNYPNPFNPRTVIGFALPQRAHVRIAVYDVLGREAALVTEGEYQPGRHAVAFDASHLPSGMYFYSVKADAYTAVKKMMLVK
ncbi:MAG: phosphodiester glycosidase family protein [Acidobacteriota bacterium]